MKPEEKSPPVDDNQNEVRHLTLAEKFPKLSEKESVESELGADDLDGEIEKIEEWEVESKKTIDDEDFENQTIKETKTFVIVGVIDPRDQQRISIYQV